MTEQTDANEVQKAEDLKEGSIQFKNGKALIVKNRRQVEFNIDYVVAQCRIALKNSRPGFYTNKIREYLKELQTEGLDAIPKIKPKLDTLKSARDINRDFINQIQQWLNYLGMFKNIKTTPTEEVPKQEALNVVASDNPTA